MGLSQLQHRNPEDVVKESGWGDDHLAKLILRTAASPHSTSTTTTFEASRTEVMASIAPTSRAVQLFAACIQLDLTGMHTLVVVKPKTIPDAMWVPEGSPMRVATGQLDKVTVGPVCKMMFAVSITSELEFATGDTASTIIGDMLDRQAAKNLDAAFFSSTAAVEGTNPAGIFADITPTGASSSTGSAAMLEDIDSLAGAISDAGGDPDRAWYLCSPGQAMVMRSLVGPRFTNPIVSVSSMDAGTFAAIDPRGIATATSGLPEISTSKVAVEHMEDTTPLPLTTAATASYPIKSHFQQDLISIRLRNRLTWQRLHDGAVQLITSTKW
jgi:hypothetical protein